MSDKNTDLAPTTPLAFGEEVARLRTSRGWSRTKLIARLYAELLDKDNEEYLVENISESWLARLESGRTVKVSRDVVESLAQALRCNAHERNRLWLYADRNVLADPNEHPNRILEIYHYVMQELYADTRSLLETMTGEHRCRQLEDEELSYLCYTALEVVLKDRKERLK